MKRYVTRHGQVMDYRKPGADHLFPPGDIFLSELGVEQAQRLGVRLREMGFHGVILSSPYQRTLHTAQEIARETGCLVTPCALIREIMMNEKTVPLFRGLTLEEIRAKFEFIDPEATLEYPWWYEKGDVPHLESEEEVRARVQIALKMIEERYPDQDVLLVGHGASAGAAIRLYGISCEPNLWKGLFNTSLSMIDPADATVPTMYCDTAHLTYGTTTSNFQLREEHDRDYLEQEWPEEIALPEGIAALRGAKILHLGDTYFRHYPYYRKLIETLRPEVIVHTGDTVEEVKIGRTPEALEEYRRKLAWLLEILQSTGARLILTPGNHDLPEEIAALAPNAECLPENSVVEIDGVACRIGHEGLHLTFDRPTFYGHSSRKDPWAGQKDLAEERRYFNALHSITVGSLSEDRFFHLPRPTVREHRP